MPPAKNQPIRLTEEAERARKLAADVDALGEIEKALAPHRMLIAREEVLRKSVRAAYADKPAEATFEAKGQRFAVLIGARGNERCINMARLWAKGGVALMKKIATTTLKALEEHAPELMLAVISIEPTGHRSLKVLELAPQIETKAA